MNGRVNSPYLQSLTLFDQYHLYHQGKCLIPGVMLYEILLIVLTHIYPIKTPLISTGTTRKVKSLRDPLSKMSKSDPQTLATISITDSPDDIALKIRRAVTDFTSEVTFDPDARPGVSNLVTIHAAVERISVEDAVSQARGLDTGAYKKLVSEAVIQRLTPIREEIQRLKLDRVYLEGVLALGFCKARELATPVLKEVRQRVGFC